MKMFSFLVFGWIPKDALEITFWCFFRCLKKKKKILQLETNGKRFTTIKFSKTVYKFLHRLSVNEKHFASLLTTFYKQTNA